jgi:hypothetical protein
MREFNSFLKFAEHLVVLGLAAKVAEHRILEHACVEIETRAREKIGQYQDAAGPFSAWQPLAEATKEQRSQAGFSPDDPLLRTGEMRDSIEHKVIGHEGHVGSNSDIALYQELGTSKIPPRSFLGASAFELAPKIVEETGAEMTAVLSGGKRRIEIP